MLLGNTSISKWDVINRLTWCTSNKEIPLLYASHIFPAINVMMGTFEKCNNCEKILLENSRHQIDYKYSIKKLYSTQNIKRVSDFKSIQKWALAKGIRWIILVKKNICIYISEYSRIGKTDLKIEDWITFCHEIRALQSSRKRYHIVRLKTKKTLPPLWSQKGKLWTALNMNPCLTTII